METPAFLEFIRLIVDGDAINVSRRLRADPSLATMASPVGATRQRAAHFFFTEIGHYIYAGDTALQTAARNSGNRTGRDPRRFISPSGRLGQAAAARTRHASNRQASSRCCSSAEPSPLTRIRAESK